MLYVSGKKILPLLRIQRRMNEVTECLNVCCMNVSYECLIILKDNKHIKDKKKLCCQPIGFAMAFIQPQDGYIQWAQKV
jgi:hypothetical protein